MSKLEGKTLVILKAKDGRRAEIVFDSYQEATDWIAKKKQETGIELDLEMARFDQEPTIEMYRQK